MFRYCAFITDVGKNKFCINVGEFVDGEFCNTHKYGLMVDYFTFTDADGGGSGGFPCF